MSKKSTPSSRNNNINPNTPSSNPYSRSKSPNQSTTPSTNTTTNNKPYKTKRFSNFNFDDDNDDDDFNLNSIPLNQQFDDQDPLQNIIHHNEQHAQNEQNEQNELNNDPFNDIFGSGPDYDIADTNKIHYVFLQLQDRYFEPKHLEALDITIVYHLVQHFYKEKLYNINFTEVAKVGAVCVNSSALQQQLDIDEFEVGLRVNPQTILPLLAIGVHIAAIFALQLYSLSATSIHINDSSFIYPTIKFRVHDYPILTSPTDIGATLLNKYVSFHATITRLSTVRPLIIELPFQCYDCQEQTLVKFDDGVYKTPGDCTTCTRSNMRYTKTWTPLYHYAKAIDWQQMLVQEIIDPEKTSAGRVPVILETEISRDLIGLHSVGDQIQIGGIVKARRHGANGYTIYLDVVSIHSVSQPNSFLDYLSHSKGDINQNNINIQFIDHDQLNSNEMIDWEQNGQQDVLHLDQQLDTNINTTIQMNPTHQILLEHQSRRKRFIEQLIKFHPVFGRVITPLYLPVEYPPIVAGGFTINEHEFQGIAHIHRQSFLPKLLVQSICPSIYGHIGAKFGILLALLGGVDRSVMSPQEISINKFNQYLKDHGISLDTDDDFFHQYKNSLLQSNNNNNHDPNNMNTNQDNINNNEHFEHHLVSNGFGGITTKEFQNLNDLTKRDNDPSLQTDSTTNSTSSTTTTPSNTNSSLKTRSNIHILLIGEPGLGKSQILRQVSSLSARGVYISGQGASGTGLTASLVKEGKGFTLQCGGVVIGDKGITCVDELDKLHEEHKSLLECMEQQTVSITKSGTICQLPARTTIIAAANPKGGTYDKNKSVLENLNINPILLSRFDLCFLILDQGNKEYDRLLTDHVIGIHTDNNQSPFGPNNLTTTRQQQQTNIHLLNVTNFDQTPNKRQGLSLLTTNTNTGSGVGYQDQRQRDLSNNYFDFDIPPTTQNDYYQQEQQQIPSYIQLLQELGYDPKQKLSQRYHMSLTEIEEFEQIPTTLLKKYIAFAREYCRPTLSPHCREIIKEFYLNLRFKTTSQNANGKSSSTSMNNTVTTRQLESLIRLTEARAKLELRPIALPIDAYEAIEIMRETMFQLLLDQQGVVDTQRLRTGQSASIRSLRQSFENALLRVGREKNNDIFSHGELRSIARSIVGFDMAKFDTIFNALRDGCDLIMAGGGYKYRPIFHDD